MLNWSVPVRTGGAGERGAAVAAVMEALGRPAFGARLLDLGGSVVDAGSVCVYRLSTTARPERYCSASREPVDRTGSCWRIYRDSLYRADETFVAALRDARPDSPVLAHLTASEVRYAPHRRRIYDDHALLDRLTVAGREVNGDLLAVNFYHHRHQGHYSDRQLAGLEDLAAIVLAAVRRDHELRTDACGAGSEASGPVRIASFEARLARRAPGLTPRELAVCARLLTGMLYEGIAADLGISLASVKTYRKRAFERLDIHFRNELYGIAVGLAADDIDVAVA